MTTVKRESFDIIAEFSRLILFWFHCDTNRYIYIHTEYIECMAQKQFWGGLGCYISNLIITPAKLYSMWFFCPVLDEKERYCDVYELFK